MTSTGDKLVAASLSMVGTPWHEHGRLPGVGLDCAGLVACSLDSIGIPYNDSSDYGQHPSLHLLTKMVSDQFTKIDRCNMRPGDLIVFKIQYRKGMDCGHIGIYCGAGSFVHTKPTDPKEVHVTRLVSSWERRIVGVFRVSKD